MDLVNDSDLDLTSSLNDVKTGLSNYLTTLNVASATKATEDEDNNNIKNTYAKQNGTYNTLFKLSDYRLCQLNSDFSLWRGYSFRPCIHSERRPWYS